MSEPKPSHIRAGEHGAEPLLLVHPFCTDAAVWKPMLPYVTAGMGDVPGMDVLAPTVAGHNRGPRLHGPIAFSVLADSVERAMDDAGWDSAHVAGNSLGGALSLELAKRGRARTVTAIAPAGGWESKSRQEMALFAKFAAGFPIIKAAGLLPPRVADWIVAEPHLRHAAMLPVARHGEQISRRDAAHLIRAAGKCSLFNRILDPRTLQTDTTITDLPAITNPVLLLLAEHDYVIPEAGGYMDRFKQELPNLTIRRMQGVGHCPQLESPAWVAAEILGHVASQRVTAAA